MITITYRGSVARRLTKLDDKMRPTGEYAIEIKTQYGTVELPISKEQYDTIPFFAFSRIVVEFEK